jgi:plasmid maintenance system antidote protein VapI
MEGELYTEEFAEKMGITEERLEEIIDAKTIEDSEKQAVKAD